jgi:phosphoglycerate transport regulatory protein PgtC
MWNTRYMNAHKLPAPRQWADLVKPEYFGHVSISSPSRSGTTHLTVETMLQGEGWDKGWTQMLQIAATAPPSPTAASPCPMASTTASTASAS